MKITKTAVAALAASSMLAMTACSSVGGTTTSQSSTSTGGQIEDKTMVTVVKVKGIAWFDRMDVGVVEWGRDNGFDTRTEGGDDVSPEKQI
ncbi:hypothetical protein M3T53_02070 [Actinomyces sp. B33]|uniref:hypothetical protein n=1 Tax=Actinomyces sp. B33 TaxID=2942131 RepID=UPI0023422B5A|nr:hypothetical protein [Actinomyces sp. B33]MDC4232503.1 hypothetical protein [Actinomyces sp. B33]